MLVCHRATDARNVWRFAVQSKKHNLVHSTGLELTFLDAYVRMLAENALPLLRGRLTAAGETSAAYLMCSDNLAYSSNLDSVRESADRCVSGRERYAHVVRIVEEGQAELAAFALFSRLAAEPLEAERGRQIQPESHECAQSRAESHEAGLHHTGG